ncbi:hypothetical protein AKO1_001210 [Acrasis kona]|uniref:Uncharacterized protein n=1 Tax=Acrasis kona TaxID=1008807 RepID=A0AAW2ZDU5_9EUKA
MTECYIYPSKQDLDANWKAQKGDENVIFRCRGMNDASFNYLFTLMNRDDYGKMKHLDVSFNALTNKSLFFLHALSQQNVSILAIHNLFDFGSVKAKFQEFVTLISRPIPLQKIDGLNNLES